MPFSAQTRMSGINLDGREIRKGAADAIAAYVKANGGVVSPELHAIVDRIARAGGTPLVVAERTRTLGVVHLKDIVKGGMRQRFAALAGDGHQDGDDHGRQPADGGVDRQRSGRRRLPGAGDAGRQDGAHPARAGRGQARRDDRRRHQRRAGAGAGRRRRRDEHRHDGRQRSRQHGRSRLEPDQADRDRRDRQAAPDDARRADDVLDRERRGEVLRHHPGDVHPGVPAAWRAQRHAAGHARVGHSLGCDLQRGDHHRADSAGAEGHRRTSRWARRRSCGATC